MSGGGDTSTTETEEYDPKKTGQTFGRALDDWATEIEAGETPYYGQDLYSGLSGTTYGALDGMMGVSGSSDYSNGVWGAMNDYSKVAAGDAYGTNDPGYATLRQDVIDDTMAAVNTTFNDSGRFGSGSHVNSAAQGVGSAVAALDYENFMNDRQYQMDAANMMSTLYGAAMAPYETQLGVGQAYDADAQAQTLADYDLWERSSNADYNKFLELLGAFNSTQDSSGMENEADLFDWAGLFTELF